MIANEAVYLNKEVKRLEKYGLDIIVQPDQDKYNLRFRDTKEMIEPYCSSTEVLGIINSIEVIFERIKNEKNKSFDMDIYAICSSNSKK